MPEGGQRIVIFRFMQTQFNMLMRLAWGFLIAGEKTIPDG
jgi:hypothetical protein